MALGLIYEARFPVMGSMGMLMMPGGCCGIFSGLPFNADCMNCIHIGNAAVATIFMQGLRLIKAHPGDRNDVWVITSKPSIDSDFVWYLFCLLNHVAPIF